MQKERQESSRGGKLLRLGGLQILWIGGLASDRERGKAFFAKVEQGKELAGLAGIS
jgi:hypothetical protein